jgi:hypothetical protein
MTSGGVSLRRNAIAFLFLRTRQVAKIDFRLTIVPALANVDG